MDRVGRFVADIKDSVTFLVNQVQFCFKISSKMMLCYPCHSYIDENIYSDFEMYSD